MVTNGGRVKVLDFGLAKDVSAVGSYGGGDGSLNPDSAACSLSALGGKSYGTCDQQDEERGHSSRVHTKAFVPR